MPSAIIKGLTTIKWGSGDVLGTPQGAVVESIRTRPAEGTGTEITDGDGFTIAMVVMDNGFDAEVTCLYDSNKTWPSVGDTVTLTVPGKGSKNCVVVADPEINLARKREATISFTLAYRPGLGL